jgi:hypothetical protein
VSKGNGSAERTLTCFRRSRNDCSDYDTKASKEDGYLPALPIGHPNEECSRHLTNLKDRKDNTRSGLFILGHVVVVEVIWDRIDTAHERAIVACPHYQPWFINALTDLTIHGRTQVDDDAATIESKVPFTPRTRRIVCKSSCKISIDDIDLLFLNHCWRVLDFMSSPFVLPGLVNELRIERETYIDFRHS